MGGKTWSKEDEQRLVTAYQSGLTAKQIAAMFPNRTTHAVITHASKIGAAESVAWTPEEDAILAEIWASPRSIKVGLHRLPNRTYDAARVHAIAIGLGSKAPAQKGSRSPYFNGIIKAIKDNGPLTTLEISKLLKACRRTIQRILDDCHGTDFHVGDWRKVGSNHIAAAWALGALQDAPRPAPKSANEAHKDYRQRKKIREGRYDPFAVAAGLLCAPKSTTVGRIYIHLHDDELEAA